MKILKKTKSIISNDNILSLIGYLVPAATGLLSIFILTRYLSIDAFGEYSLYVSGVLMLQTISYGINNLSLIRYLSCAKTIEEEKEITGSGWVITFASTAVIAAVVILTKIIFNKTVSASGFDLFFKWYPLLCLVKLPHTNSFAILSAKKRFFSIIIIRIIDSFGFPIFLVLNFFWLKTGVEGIILGHIMANIIPAVYTLINNQSGIRYLGYAKMKSVRMLFHFGKFSFGTLIGISLLKYSDCFIIGILMDKAAVAVYSIPLRLLDILVLPLNSFSAVALPGMSRAFKENSSNYKVKHLYYSYTGVLSILFFPVLLIMFFFSRELVFLLGGAKYIQSVIAPLVLKTFLIYSLFLSLDTFTGTVLNSINKPNYNFIKIAVMAFINIAGDIFAIYAFRSVVAVAIVSIINIAVGCLIGIYFLKKEINIKIHCIPRIGFRILKRMSIKLFS